MPRPKRRDPFRVFFREDRKCWVVEFGHGDERGQKYPPAEVKGRENVTRWARENFGGAVPIKRDTTSLSALYDMWIDERWKEVRRKDGMLSPATVSNNKTHGEAWIKEKLGNLAVTDVGSPELLKFIREIRDAGRDASTVRNIYYSLVAFFDDVIAEKWTKLKINPARDPGVVKVLPKVDKSRGGEGVITVPIEVADALINSEHVPIFRRVAYVLLATLGIRAGERAGLLVGDVNLDRETIRIERQLAHRSKAGKGTELRDPKRNSKRTLPLHPAAVDALREWLAEWECFVGRKPQDTDALFPDAEGKARREREAAVLREDLEASGLPTKNNGASLTIQALRRSVSSWLDARGVSQDKRGRLLGHALVGVTGANYTEANVEVLREAVCSLPFAWTRLNAGSIAGSDSVTASRKNESSMITVEVRAGFEPAYNGFAKKSGAGPRAAESARDNDELAAAELDANGPVGRKLPPVASDSDPEKEGFAVAVAEHSADSAVAVLNSTPGRWGKP